MTNVYSIATGTQVPTKQEQIEMVQDMFEDFVAYVAEEPLFADMGVDDTYDAVLGFIHSNDARG